ncbi:MAG: hypothetical protein KDC98_04190 [Planctomycetes bacterium]|nr:hypothetical protein [Planctomycetota bacterium]
MRVLATAAVCLLPGCTSTLLLEPVLTVSPYYVSYQLRGDVALQTEPEGGGPLQDNPPRQLSEFGQEHHEDDVGFRAEFGDGFAGLRVDYYRMDTGTATPGVLGSDWGNLLEGELVRMQTAMDEVRLSYVEPITRIETTFKGEDLTFDFAAGGEWAYRDMTLRAQTDDTERQQRVKILGETVSVAARIRTRWRDLTLDLDYALCPNLTTRGDFGDINHDIEVRASYSIPLRDVTFFAGYRYSSLDAVGTTDKLAYDAALQIDGFQFGLTVSL